MKQPLGHECVCQLKMGSLTTDPRYYETSAKIWDISSETYGLECLGRVSLEVPKIKFDLDISVCYCVLSTDTSKSNLRPYNIVQMSI